MFSSLSPNAVSISTTFETAKRMVIADHLPDGLPQGGKHKDHRKGAAGVVIIAPAF
jgi:hypothetical protein